MRKLSIAVAILLVTAIGAVLVGPSFIDWSDHKDAVAREISDLTGRRLAIEGEVELALLPSPRLRAEKVTLSTLHASKGLEFSMVFIAGLEAGVVPFIREDEEDVDKALEEERRLLYVGMTRAERRIILTRARQRTLFGRRLDGNPSPFLDEISDDLIRFVRENARKRKPRPKDDGQMSLF